MRGATVLAQYVADTQDLLNDVGGQFFQLPQLHRFINKSRRRIAANSGCLRVVPAGVQTKASQEVYKFSEWNSLVQQQLPGVQSILRAHTISIAIGVGGWKPMWRRTVFSDFQARFRIYNGTFYGVISEPGWWAQFGEGPYGSIYLAPIPSQAMPIDADLICLPAPLLTDKDVDPIPYPWIDAVPWWAAVLCLLAQQRREDAAAMQQLFAADLPMCASVVCPVMLQSPYGATMRSA